VPNDEEEALTPEDVGLPDEPDDSPATDEPGWVGTDYAGNAAPNDNQAVRLDGTPIAPQASTPITKQSGKISMSTQGVPGGAKRVGDIFQQAEAQAQDDAAPYEQAYDKEAAVAGKAYGDKADAVDEEGGLSRDFFDRERELHDRQIDFLQTQANLEKQAAIESEASAHKYIEGYEHQLAGVRQLIQTSGDPLGNLSMGQAAGLSFGAFAQGFLAARGIQIDVTGQIDRWVDRKIKEHQMDIQNARESANDQLHLYEIARQTSTDEYEARQRYRGFVVEGLKTSILANASRFNSDVAMARAKSQIATLDLEAAQTSNAILERRRGMELGFRQLRIGEAAQKGHLELAKSQLALAQEREARLAAAKNKGTAGLIPIRDIESTAGPDGKEHYAIVGYANPKDAAALKATREDRVYSENIFKSLKEYEALRNRAYEETKGAPVSQKWDETKYPVIRELKRARESIIQTIREARTGKAFSDSEAKEYEALVPNETWWEKGNNYSATSQLREAVRNKYESSVHTYSQLGPNGEEDPTGVVVAPHSAAEFRTMQSTGKPVKELPDTVAGSAQGTDKAQTKPTRAWSELMDGNQPHNAHAVDVIAKIIADPVRGAKVAKSDPAFKGYEIPDNAAMFRAQAIDSLRNMASGGDHHTAVFASKALTLLQNDPQGFANLFWEVPVADYSNNQMRLKE
jgi:hypothetical protein